MNVVITGGPSSGKTTVLHLLEARGFPTINEKATEIIQEGHLHPLKTYREFNEEVIKRYLLAEARSFGPWQIVFQDRGCFDPLAYTIMDGAEPPAGIRDVRGNRYHCAFLMEPLNKFVDDGIRFEDLEYTRKLTPILESTYRAAGVRVIRVPSFSARAREAFIMAHLLLMTSGKHAIAA